MGKIAKCIILMVITLSVLMTGCGEGEKPNLQDQLDQLQHKLTVVEQELSQLKEEQEQIESQLASLQPGVSETTVPLPIPRTATKVVAASNSSDLGKKQADYACDGTDDQVEIQAAIDAVDAVGGGCVLLLEGNYSISDTIDVASNLIIRGMGTNTILTLADGVDDKHMFSNIELPRSRTHLTIENLRMEGNFANTVGSSGGIFFEHSGVEQAVDHFTLRNCYIRDFRYNLVHLYTYSHYFIFEGNHFESTNNVGIYIDNHSDHGIITHNYFQDCYIMVDTCSYLNITQNQFYGDSDFSAFLQFQRGATHNIIDSNVSLREGAGVQPFITLLGMNWGGNPAMEYYKITNNLIVGGSSGIRLKRMATPSAEVKNNLIAGNFVDCSIGIELIGADNNTVQGNKAIGCTKGISIDSESDDNLVLGNDLSGRCLY